MAQPRKRIWPLDTAGSIAVENAKVYEELRRGRIDPALPPRPNLFNQRSAWVISGHVGLHEKASALPPKADILQGG